MAMGRPSDPRPFVPHLTLARVREARKDFWEALGKEMEDVSWLCFTVDSLVLWESVLHPDGARYMTRQLFSALMNAE